MKFTAIKTNLVEGLQMIQKAMSSKNTMPILSGIHLLVANGQLKMTATDLEVRIEASVPVEVLEEGETVVPGRAFSDLVRRLPDLRVVFENISREGEDRLSIHYGDAKASLNGWPGREYPTLPDAEDIHELSIATDELKKAVSLTAFSVNPDEIRPIFTGLLMEIRDHDITFVGTDSFRLALYKTNINNRDEKPFDLIVPVRALNEVARIAPEEEVIKIIVSTGRIEFELGDVRLTTSLIRGEYPPYDRVVPTGHSSFYKIERNVLSASLERATLFSREKDGTAVVRMVLENSLIHIHTESDFGQVNEHLPVYQEGEEVDISFNARFLLDGMKAMRFDSLDVSLNGALGPCVIRPENNQNYLYLILPLRR